jgi:DNA-binding MarR family transcriptional regulator
MKIEEAIQQKQFRSVYQKTVVNILYTASWLNQITTNYLRPFGISGEQYNILRILRGMHPETATVKTLTERMLDRMSNASRLVEKLKQKGLVDRRECPFDRRRVDISITQKGLDLLEETAKFMDQDYDRRLEVLGQEEAEELNRILDKLRQ